MSRLLERIAHMYLSTGSLGVEWKAWTWRREINFVCPSSKAIYLDLKAADSGGWSNSLNKLWSKDWTTCKWSQVLENIWKAKCEEKDKVFLWRLLFGHIPKLGSKLRPEALEMGVVSDVGSLKRP